MKRIVDFVVNHGLMMLLQLVASIFLLMLIAGYTEGAIVTVLISLVILGLHQFYFRNKNRKKGSEARNP